jgi:hypothetical protein
LDLQTLYIFELFWGIQCQLKLRSHSLDIRYNIVEIVDIGKPLGPTFDREKNLSVFLFRYELFQVECVLFTWSIRTYLLIDFSDAINVFLVVLIILSHVLCPEHMSCRCM